MERLIDKYFPADYSDSFSRVIPVGAAITPDEFFEAAFCRYPGWIEWLFRLRNMLVKPFGLNDDRNFRDIICEKDDCEIIVGTPDKHLTFHASLLCGEVHDGRQSLRITTVVRYNNRLGRVYFFFVGPVHRMLMRSTLGRIEKAAAGKI